MKRVDTFVVAGILGVSVITASAITAVTAWHSPVSTATAASSATVHHNPPEHVSLVIATPDMLGTDEMPAYMPSNLSLPADTDVTITVVNFDDATALTGGTAQFATATGIKGKVSVQALDPTKPNDSSGPVTQVTSMDPQEGVSHTFTITSLHINVPIAPKSKTTFTIHTGKAGTYHWQCYDPCGPNAMAAEGYMKGTLTVV